MCLRQGSGVAAWTRCGRAGAAEASRALQPCSPLRLNLKTELCFVWQCLREFGNELGLTLGLNRRVVETVKTSLKFWPFGSYCWSPRKIIFIASLTLLTLQKTQLYRHNWQKTTLDIPALYRSSVMLTPNLKDNLSCQIRIGYPLKLLESPPVV